MNPLKSEILRLLKEQTRLTTEQITPLLERPSHPASSFPKGSRPSRNGTGRDRDGTDRPELGDYALACFRLAKKLKKAPEQIAADLAGKLKPQGLIQRIQPVKGYINFFADPVKLSPLIVNQILKDGSRYGQSSIGQGKSVVIDFSSPNIAKPFGIGHLRSTVIGSALYKIYSALGYKCVGINHLGDWGTQFGHMIYGWKTWGKKELEPLAMFDVSKVSLEDASKYYRLSASTQDPSIQEQARREFKKLENNDPENKKLWNQFKDKSLEEFERIYKRLGIKFDKYEGEAFYNQFVPATLKEIEQKKLSQTSEGALVVNLEKYGMPPCLLRKSDGATLYATRDIAGALHRYKEHQFAKLLYVVGADQKLYFRQLFKVLGLMGYDWAKDCVHVDFGLIRFKGGKMSTRKGKTILLEEVLAKTIELSKNLMQQRAPELQLKVDPAKTDEIARAVGMGAVIFNELKNKRIKDSDFDWDKILTFNGETGPYLQYTYVRLCSLTRKYQETFPSDTESSGRTCDQSPDQINPADLDYTLLKEVDEITLIKEMSFFPEIIQQAADEYEPSVISNYLLSLASLFNRYYRYHRIVDTSNRVLSQLRFALVQCLKYILHTGLTLLGITVLEEM